MGRKGHRDEGLPPLLAYLEEIKQTAATLERTTDRAADAAQTQPGDEDRPDILLYRQVEEGVKQAIDESGMDRDVVLSLANDWAGREGRCRATPAMFDQYLAPAATGYKLPLWLVVGICLVTGSSAPIRPIVDGLGLTTAGRLENEFTDLGRMLDLRDRLNRDIRRQRKRIAALKERQIQNGD